MSDDLKARVDSLASLMDQFKLGEAELEGQGWKVSMRRRPALTAVATMTSGATTAEPQFEDEVDEVEVVQAPVGIPISSPMNGIYYSSSSPSSPPFVKEGDTVNAGQVVALIEAMKVFNEINAPMSGTVRKLAATSGNVVAQGEALMYIS